MAGDECGCWVGPATAHDGVSGDGDVHRQDQQPPERVVHQRVGRHAAGGMALTVNQSTFAQGQSAIVNPDGQLLLCTRRTMP